MKRLFLLAFIWGWSFLFIKVAVAGMTPTTVAAARIGLGAAVLMIVLRIRGLRLPTDRTMWRHFAVAALLGSALPFTMLAWGEERITSALTAVLNASTPLFTAMAGAAVLRERLRPVQLMGLLVGLVGVAVAAGVGGGDLSGDSFAGGAASVAAGACYGAGFIYIKRHLMTIPAEVAATGQLVAGVVMLAPLAVVTTAAEGIHLPPHRLAAVILLGAVGTGVAYVLNYRIVADLGPTKASLVTYLIPVVAVVVGVVVLDEPFRLSLLAGGVLVITGISMVHRRLRLPRGPRPVPAAGTAIVLVLVTGLTTLLGACGGGGQGRLGERGSASSPPGCGAAITEPLDPSSALHLLPGATEPDYLTEPPTSGPHLSGRPPSGALDRPLDRPTQVLVLEEGGVLIQHRDLGPHATAQLETLAGPRVVVAPNPDLPAPVVATAWLAKRTCDRVDLEALRQFVDNQVGSGAPGEDSPAG